MSVTPLQQKSNFRRTAGAVPRRAARPIDGCAGFDRLVRTTPASRDASDDSRCTRERGARGGRRRSSPARTYVWIETTSGMIRIATMFVILIIGLIAGPA